MLTVRSMRFIGALSAAGLLAACAVTPAAGAAHPASHGKHPGARMHGSPAATLLGHGTATAIAAA